MDWIKKDELEWHMTQPVRTNQPLKRNNKWRTTKFTATNEDHKYKTEEGSQNHCFKLHLFQINFWNINVHMYTRHELVAIVDWIYSIKWQSSDPGICDWTVQEYLHCQLVWEICLILSIYLGNYFRNKHSIKYSPHAITLNK